MCFTKEEGILHVYWERGRRSVARCISCFQVIHQIIQDPNCDKPDVPTLFVPACRLT